ncbi:dihydroneopterin aldolase [Sphingomonas aracearum]|uniref:dihydroneopterin aldolase n=1 Tax=Sphingomonas aracearum TaxID=2283317 RepID=A0A369VTU2_9SPHN|nr:dihydroneopterin aldolase [Sphingomonas aracearum]RDE05269.1 dihydroneopterin aldolase [Sphingomonas aracearum]
MPDYVIHLERLAVRMRMGIHPAERSAPQRVLIDVALTATYPRAPREDAIEEVADYDFVRTGILALAAERHFNLQETLCDAIAELALSDTRIRQVRVRSTKPDVYPDAAIGCEVVRP